MRFWTILGGLVALLALGAASPGLADEPILSFQRLSFGAQVRYADWASFGSEPVPSWGKEWEAGPSVAYVLTPKVALVASSLYGFDNQLLKTSVGVSVILWQGNDSPAVIDGTH